MQKFSKKFLAILLTLCMIASFVPFGVFAAEASAQVVEQQLMPAHQKKSNLRC